MAFIFQLQNTTSSTKSICMNGLCPKMASEKPYPKKLNTFDQKYYRFRLVPPFLVQHLATKAKQETGLSMGTN